VNAVVQRSAIYAHEGLALDIARPGAWPKFIVLEHLARALGAVATNSVYVHTPF
jgi:hypothetical protein